MIRLNNVSKTVTSGSEKLTILHAVYLSIPKGQFVAVVGPSGSGKSTLLSLVAGLDYPTTGDIRLDGEYITQMGEDELARLRRAKVGFIFQSFHLIPSLTAYENILVPMEIAGLPKARERAQLLLDEVGLRERGHHYPSQLSGGEQQRVAIARAFSNDPTILLADEPTGNLDSKNGAHVFELLVKLNREHGTTLLLVTHDHTLADRADRVISLSEGRIVEDREIERRGDGATGRWGDGGTGGRREEIRFAPSPCRLVAPSQQGGDMNFVLNMAWREMRASWRRLLLFFLCIAIGVGSIVSLRSLVQNLKASVMREARTMLGADVQVGVNQPWRPETRASLERFSNLPVVAGHTEIFETQTMARAANSQSAPPVIIELRGVQERFPLYGEVRLAGGTRYTHALLRDRGALAHPGALARLNLKVGDEVKIGQLTFSVRGVIERLPGGADRFNLIPRVVVDLADVPATGLAGFGSRVSYQWLLKAREGQDQAMLQELRREFRTMRVDFWWSFREMQGVMSERLRLTEGFVGLVGLAILALGGVGIASVTRVFVQQKLKTIAILKCLGGENLRVLGAYLAQALALSLAGSGAGLLLASVITLLVPRYAAGRLPIELESGLTWQASVQGVGIGVMVALLFSLPLLLEIRQVKPILVLRQNTTARRRRIDWLRLGAWATIAPALFSLAIWQSGSIRYAGIFLGIAVTTILVLGFAGAALTHALRRARRLPSFALRQGVSSLYRPGNQTRTILFAVGLGALFVIAVRIQQVNALKEFDFDLSAASADMFLIDIQKDQRPAAEAAIARMGGVETTIIPIVQGRIIGLRRAPGNLSDLPRDQVGRMLSWERRFTYRPHREESEEIIAGKFWEPQPAAEPEISVEERYARDLQLGLDDKLIFDFLGQRIEAKITSIRRVERRISPLAYLTRATVLFRPGALEAAPQFFIGAVKGPPPGATRARLQREFVEQFPNVTMIDAFDTIAEVRKRAGEISFAVSFIGGFVFLCGALILAGSVAMTKYQRLYEAAILKTLGAEKKLIVYITLIEYGVLGLLAGAIGSSAAIGLTWAISKYGMKIPWRLAPSVNLTGVAVTLLLVTAVGALSSWDVMTKKPLGILRAE